MQPDEIRCALCGEPGNEENPGADGIVIEINPITMRRAAMHQICLVLALEEMDPERLDRYTKKIQG